MCALGIKELFGAEGRTDCVVVLVLSPPVGETLRVFTTTTPSALTRSRATSRSAEKGRAEQTRIEGSGGRMSTGQDGILKQFDGIRRPVVERHTDGRSKKRSDFGWR